MSFSALTANVLLTTWVPTLQLFLKALVHTQAHPLQHNQHSTFRHQRFAAQLAVERYAARLGSVQHLLSDLTLPLLSIFSGRGLDEQLRAAFAAGAGKCGVWDGMGLEYGRVWRGGEGREVVGGLDLGLVAS
jgi:hypothetical protein